MNTNKLVVRIDFMDKTSEVIRNVLKTEADIDSDYLLIFIEGHKLSYHLDSIYCVTSKCQKD